MPGGTGTPRRCRGAGNRSCGAGPGRGCGAGARTVPRRRRRRGRPADSARSSRGWSSTGFRRAARPGLPRSFAGFRRPDVPAIGASRPRFRTSAPRPFGRRCGERRPGARRKERKGRSPGVPPGRAPGRLGAAAPREPGGSRRGAPDGVLRNGETPPWPFQPFRRGGCPGRARSGVSRSRPRHRGVGDAVRAVLRVSWTARRPPRGLGAGVYPAGRRGSHRMPAGHGRAPTCRRPSGSAGATSWPAAIA